MGRATLCILSGSPAHTAFEPPAGVLLSKGGAGLAPAWSEASRGGGGGGGGQVGGEVGGGGGGATSCILSGSPAHTAFEPVASLPGCTVAQWRNPRAPRPSSILPMPILVMANSSVPAPKKRSCRCAAPSLMWACSSSDAWRTMRFPTFNPPHPPALCGGTRGLHSGHVGLRRGYWRYAGITTQGVTWGYAGLRGATQRLRVLRRGSAALRSLFRILGSFALLYQVVIVRQCRRFTAYSGYADTYKCKGPIAGDVVQDILTLDACRERHFEPFMMMRDIRKAFTGFSAAKWPVSAFTSSHPGSDFKLERLDGCTGSNPLVSTGRWGCGVFGGTPGHKFMQQVIAARLAGVCLAFSTFGSPDGCDKLLHALQQHPCSVKQAWHMLLRCKSSGHFVSDMLQALSPQSSYCLVG